MFEFFRNRPITIISSMINKLEIERANHEHNITALEKRIAHDTECLRQHKEASAAITDVLLPLSVSDDVDEPLLTWSPPPIDKAHHFGGLSDEAKANLKAKYSAHA